VFNADELATFPPPAETNNIGLNGGFLLEKEIKFVQQKGIFLAGGPDYVDHMNDICCIVEDIFHGN